MEEELKNEVFVDRFDSSIKAAHGAHDHNATDPSIGGSSYVQREGERRK